MTSLGDRILRLLAERWPVTVDDVATALRARPDSVRLEVKRLAARGRVTVENLGGRTYVALAGRPSGPPAKPRDEDDPAFL